MGSGPLPQGCHQVRTSLCFVNALGRTGSGRTRGYINVISKTLSVNPSYDNTFTPPQKNTQTFPMKIFLDCLLSQAACSTPTRLRGTTVGLSTEHRAAPARGVSVPALGLAWACLGSLPVSFLFVTQNWAHVLALTFRTRGTG